jgi:hypothetical protein
MSLAHGNDGTAKVATADILELQSWTYDEEDIAVVEKSSMGDTAAVPYPSGCKRGGGQIECLWDDGDTTGQDLMIPGASLAVKLQPEGDATTDIEYTGTVVILSKGLKVEKAGLNTVSFAFQGVLAKGAVSS